MNWLPAHSLVQRSNGPSKHQRPACLPGRCAGERSFTRAAAKLGISQLALSHTVRGLKTRLGVRLLTRTTRSVSPTEAGERLMHMIGPRLEEIEAELRAVSDLAETPSGTIRITAIDHVVDSVLWPRVSRVLETFPDVHVEISADYRMVDIAAERYDIGVRHGDQVQKDMIAVRLTTDIRMTIVGSPRYFETHKVPTTVKACRVIAASRSASRAVVRSTPGSCAMATTRSRCGSMDRSHSMARTGCCRLRSTDMGWPSCRRSLRSLRWTRDGFAASWMTPDPCSLACTRIIRAAGTRLGPYDWVIEAIRHQE
jgi:DNA-binding transcriptional LysR family regulator